MPDDTQDEIIVREFPVELSESEDGRTLEVRIVPYGVPTQVADSPENGGTGKPYMEEWMPGVFARQENAANRIEFKIDDETAKAVLVNFEHERGIGGVVGRGQAIWDASDGARGIFRMLSTQDADKVLELVNEGVLSGVSLEAIPIRSRKENGVVKREKARLLNIALCRRAAYPDAKVLAVREEPAPEPEPEPEPEPSEPAPDEELVPAVSEAVRERVIGDLDREQQVKRALERVCYQPLLLRAVVRTPWDGAASRFEDDEWQRSCVLDRGDQYDTAKTRYAFPVLEPNGDLNVNGMHAAAARLNQANATPAQKSAAARKLIRYYRQAEEDAPPALVAMAGRG